MIWYSFPSPPHVRFIMAQTAIPFMLDGQNRRKPLAYKAMSAVGVVLFAHAGFTAWSMKDSLQAHHHADSHAAAAAQSLPILTLVEVLLAFLLLVASLFHPNRFYSLLRKDTARHLRYDHSAYTGFEFISFNHRGNSLLHVKKR